MGDYYESTFAISKNGKNGVVFLSNNFEKKTMYPDWSTEDLALQTFQQINSAKKLK